MDNKQMGILSLPLLPRNRDANNIVDVGTARDVAVKAVAWRVAPTLTGAATGQTSSVETQHGSSFVSSDSTNMPPGFISPAVNRTNTADLIRGRRALRPFSASAHLYPLKQLEHLFLSGRRWQ
jgi:hypothetical protein